MFLREPRLPKNNRKNNRVHARGIPFSLELLSSSFNFLFRNDSDSLPLERCDSARAGGGALPVIMSIIRSSRNQRLPQLQTSECAAVHSSKK